MRAQQLWSNPKFNVDETSDEFARINPSTVAMANARPRNDDAQAGDGGGGGGSGAEREEIDTSGFVAAEDAEESSGDDVAEAQPRQNDSTSRLFEVEEGVDGIAASVGRRRRKPSSSKSMGDRALSSERRAEKKLARKREEEVAQSKVSGDKRARRSFDAEMLRHSKGARRR